MAVDIQLIRCPWPGLEKSEIYQDYHDNEWGIPSFDDAHLFEMLVLESFQSGLSWLTILNKRESFRMAFDGFDVQKVASYDKNKINELMANKAIVRSAGKINASVQNAQVFIKIQREYKSFSNYLWSFTQHKVIHDLPITNQSELSLMISSDLKRKGMKYLGPVTTEAYLEAVGILNHHDKKCFKFSVNNA